MGYNLNKIKISTNKRIKATILLLFFILQIVFPTVLLAWGEFTFKDESELGKKFNVLVRSRMPLIQDPEITNYIEGIVKRLANAMPSQPFTFQPSVVSSSTVNAFATPGGYIFVYTGLILAMENESELAGVLAHEMAHVTQRHIAHRIENEQILGLVSMLGILAGAFIGGDGGTAAAFGGIAASQTARLSYSRANEEEADQVGMNYLTAAKFSPYGMPGAFEILARRQWSFGSDIPSYLSTHPNIQERIKETKIRITRLSQKQQSISINNKNFKRIQTLARSRYSDPNVATIYFKKNLNGPEKSETLMGLAILASRQNKIHEAATYFNQALELAPNDELILREAGAFHYTKGNKPKGTEYLEKAVSLNRNDIMALFYYARCLADSGSIEQAVENLKIVRRHVPEDSEVYFYLARYSGELNKMFEANLYMAYSFLYENQQKQIDKFLKKAEELAKNNEQQKQIKAFQSIYKERKLFWK